MGVMQPQARKAWGPGSWKRHEGPSPGASGENPALLTP